MKLKGILLSEENEIKDIKNLKEEIDFIIIRAGYTSYSVNKKNYEDTKFREYIDQIINYNIPIGIYYESCAVTEKEAQKEANYFLKILDSEYKNYPLYVHIKDNHNTIIYSNMSQEKLSKEELTDIVLTFSNIIKDNNYNIGILSSIDWFNKKLNDYKINYYNHLIIDNEPSSKDYIYVYKTNKKFKSDNNIQIILEERSLYDKVTGYIKMIYKLGIDLIKSGINLIKRK